MSPEKAGATRGAHFLCQAHYDPWHCSLVRYRRSSFTSAPNSKGKGLSAPFLPPERGQEVRLIRRGLACHVCRRAPCEAHCHDLGKGNQAAVERLHSHTYLIRLSLPAAPRGNLQDTTLTAPA